MSNSDNIIPFVNKSTKKTAPVYTYKIVTRQFNPQKEAYTTTDHYIKGNALGMTAQFLAVADEEAGANFVIQMSDLDHCIRIDDEVELVSSKEPKASDKED